MAKISHLQNPRVTAGKYKKISLSVPVDVRPITDRVKKSIFDTLAPYIKNAICFDVFAGSGNIGIEALSRGAQKVIFIEKSRRCTEIIQKNIEKCAIPETNYKIINLDYQRAIPRVQEENPNIIFIDPPFSKTADVKLKKLLRVAKPSTLFILKLPNIKIQSSYFDGFKILTKEIFGANVIYYMNALTINNELMS